MNKEYNIDDKTVSELIGLIRGIKADNKVNVDELLYLKSWIKYNYKICRLSLFTQMVELIDKVIDDNVIDEDEKNQLVVLAEKVEKTLNQNMRYSIFNLKGILKGIISDQKINEMEITSLKRWMDLNLYLKDEYFFEKIYSKIKMIMNDGMISLAEAEELKLLCDSLIITPKENMIINYIREKIKIKRNIGNDIISLYDNKELIDKIYKNAEAELLKAVRSPSNLNEYDTEFIFIALVLVGLEKYNGGYYEFVEETFPSVYDRYSRQRIEGVIRTITKKYISDTENSQRIINYILENSIVPKTYLDDFFDFMYDIYKVNFQFMLTENTLDEDIAFVYEGLRQVFETETDEINLNVTNKTYKLIKTTKNLIFNQDSNLGLINFSKKVLKIIDNYYWKNEIEHENSYFNEGLSEWLSKNDKQIKEEQKNRKEKVNFSRWQPWFELCGKNLYLNTPAHNVKTDYKSLKIYLYENEKIVKTIAPEHIYAIFGGYKISTNKILIDNPFNNIRYKIFVEDKILYDSKDFLYREYILFNETGKEIHPNKEYEGNLFIAYKPNMPVDSSINMYANMNNYLLGNTFVNNKKVLMLYDDFITFSSEIMAGIIGEKYDDTYIFYNQYKFQVYKKVNQIVFESTLNENEIAINCNNTRTRLVELEFIKREKNAQFLYVINYPLIDANYYEIDFFEIKTGKTIKNSKFKFVLDPAMSYEIEKIDSNNYYLLIESSLALEKNDYDIDISNYDEFCVNVDINGMLHAKYELPLPIMMYKIDEQKWTSFDNYIWIGDIDIYSKLKVKGASFDTICIADEERIITKIIPKVKDDMSFIDIGVLINYKESYSKIDLILMREEHIVERITCYNKIVLAEDYPKISYDPDTELMQIALCYFGKGSLNLKMSSESGIELISKKIFENETLVEIPNFVSNEEIEIILVKEIEEFSFETEEVLFNKKMRFYSYMDLVNKYIKISSVNFDQYNKAGICIRKTFYLHGTYFEFKEYLGEKRYIAEIYVMKNGQKCLFSKLNPIEMELLSELNGTFLEVAAEKDGDGLLIDFDNRTILSDLENPKAPDVFSYNLNMERI